MPRKTLHRVPDRLGLRLFVSLFVFWFTMGFGMAADPPVFFGEASIVAASCPAPSPGNDRPHCPLRNLPHLSGSLLPGPPAAAPRLDGCGPVCPDFSQALISIDLTPPGHIPIAS